MNVMEDYRFKFEVKLIADMAWYFKDLINDLELDNLTVSQYRDLIGTFETIQTNGYYTRLVVEADEITPKIITRYKLQLTKIMSYKERIIENIGSNAFEEDLRQNIINYYNLLEDMLKIITMIQTTDGLVDNDN